VLRQRLSASVSGQYKSKWLAARHRGGREIVPKEEKK